MNVRMFKLPVTCPTCGRGLAYRATEADVQAKRAMPALLAIATVECSRRGCVTLITLRAGAWHGAVPDGALPISGPQPALRADPQLTARQAVVCRLASEGLSDRRISSQLGIGLPAVRKHLEAACARLRAIEPGLPATSPRRTLAAWQARRAPTGAAVDVFGAAA